MNEWWMITAMACGGILFSAGGTHIPRIGGQKWLRRFLLPVILGSIALIAGFEAWRCFVYVILLIGAMHLPYGEKTPYWLKALVFTSFILPALIFGWSWWQVISPVVTLVIFWLGNNFIFEKVFIHKVWEFASGVLIGVVLSTINVW